MKREERSKEVMRNRKIRWRRSRVLDESFSQYLKPRPFWTSQRDAMVTARFYSWLNFLYIITWHSDGPHDNFGGVTRGGIAFIRGAYYCRLGGLLY